MYLSVTDYQEFVPILQAVTGHKDVVTKKVFIEGVLSEILDEISKNSSRRKPSRQMLKARSIPIK